MKEGLVAAGLATVVMFAAHMAAQGPPPQTPPPAAGQPPAGPPAAPQAPGGRGQGRGGGRAAFPAQQRALADPAVVARGKTLYEINCRSCHGPDLRGGDR